MKVRGGNAINICMCKAVSTQHLGSRSMPPEEFLNFRHFQIASGAFSALSGTIKVEGMHLIHAGSLCGCMLFLIMAILCTCIKLLPEEIESRTTRQLNWSSDRNKPIGIKSRTTRQLD